MRFSRVLTLAAATGGVAISVAASAQTPTPIPAMTPDDIVAGRRAAYFLSGALFFDLREAAERGTDVKDQEFSARQLARWARTLPRMFPPGTELPTSNAMPGVWTDRPGFEAKAQAYADAAGKLADLAKANDRAGFLAQMTVVHDACDACHKVYHKPATPQAK